MNEKVKQPTRKDVVESLRLALIEYNMDPKKPKELTDAMRWVKRRALEEVQEHLGTGAHDVTANELIEAEESAEILYNK
jgi:hypothetical protein